MHGHHRLPRLSIVLTAMALSACGPPSAAEVGAESAPTLIAATNPRAWDYVSIGGDFAYGQGWEEIFAEHLEKDLGVEIRFQDLSTHDNIKLDEALARLEADADLRRAVEEAEVLTVDVHLWAYNTRPEAMYRSNLCGGEDGQDCLREWVDRLAVDIGPYFDEIVRLADPSETLVYAFDLGTIFYYHTPQGTSGFQGPPLSAEQNRIAAEYAQQGWEIIRGAAEARGIKVIDLAPSFQPDGPFTVPPDEKDFLMLGFSAEGEAVIADLLRQAGYGYE